MRKAFNQFKQFLLVSVRTSATEPYTLSIINLNDQEKDFVNQQTRRMLLRKRARQYRKTQHPDWTVSLPLMPHRGSAHAIYNMR